MEQRQVRALYTDTTITVYQAYPVAIAEAALRAGRFAPPFKRERMTWIKPSFLWMMYRCGWATKPGQERVLAISISRSGFEGALAEAVLSHYDRSLHADHAQWSRELKRSSVRVQWDPERSLRLGELPYRSLQVGLGGAAVGRYVDEWTAGIADVTGLARSIRRRLDHDDENGARALLPVERPYPLPGPVATRLRVSAAAEPGADGPATRSGRAVLLTGEPPHRSAQAEHRPGGARGDPAVGHPQVAVAGPDPDAVADPHPAHGRRRRVQPDLVAVHPHGSAATATARPARRERNRGIGGP